MSAASITLAGRVSAEALMVDTCTVTRATGTTFNDTTGRTGSTTATIYTGACRVKAYDTQAQTPVAGDREWTVYPYIVSLPIAAAEVQVDDVITITDAALDPQLIGRAFIVVALSHKTHATARRLGCKEVQA